MTRGAAGYSKLSAAAKTALYGRYQEQVESYLLTMVLLTMALLTMVLLTMVLLTMVLLTRWRASWISSYFTLAMLTMALLTTY